MFFFNQLSSKTKKHNQVHHPRTEFDTQVCRSPFRHPYHYDVINLPSEPFIACQSLVVDDGVVRPLGDQPATEVGEPEREAKVKDRLTAQLRV